MPGSFPSPSPSLCSAGSPQPVFLYLLHCVLPGLGLLCRHPALLPCLSAWLCICPDLSAPCIYHTFPFSDTISVSSQGSLCFLTPCFNIPFFLCVFPEIALLSGPPSLFPFLFILPWLPSIVDVSVKWRGGSPWPCPSASCLGWGRCQSDGVSHSFTCSAAQPPSLWLFILMFFSPQGQGSLCIPQLQFAPV